MKLRVFISFVGMIFFCLAWLMLFTEQGQALNEYAWSKLRGGYSIEERVIEYSDLVEKRLRSSFEERGMSYPPKAVTYLIFKDQRNLEVYSRNENDDTWLYIKTYPVYGLSGKIGPKLLEGDNQVPEGIYGAEFLNSNSKYHLSIRLDYPNSFDKWMAQVDGRTNLGSDIMIHGTSSSIGCVAVGNEASEDLFILAALASKENVRVVISPTDYRQTQKSVLPMEPVWIGELYQILDAELKKYKK